jgi:glycosyltransferase involved in cell wall biosynthesis
MALPRDRFDAVVAWSCYWGPLGDKLKSAGVPVHQLPFNRAARLGEAVSGIRGIRPDIFHSFSYRKDDRDVRAASEAGVPAIVTARGNVRFWDPVKTVQEWEIFRNQRTQRITVCSRAVAQVVREVEGVPGDRIRLIYNGVKLRARASGAGMPAAPLIGYIANYRPEKGHETLLRAFRRVLDAAPSARLVCCGGGSPEVKMRLQALAADIGIEARTELLDLQLDVDRIYGGMDLYVHASDTEGFSNTLLEAMAHGLPIVATSAGGNVEAVRDGESGLLTPPGDPARLSEAILTLLGDSALAARLGRAAHDRAKECFPFENMLHGYTELYEEELAKQ